MLNQIRNTASYIKGLTRDFCPEFGIVLGSGLGNLADEIEASYIVEYKDIEGFPVSTVEGHKGRLIFGFFGQKKVVAMQGRFHYYEGYQPWQVVFPVRVMASLGIKYLFVSNAAGGVNPSFKVGDLMVINDQINLLPNPLIGKNIDELGARFPDMNDTYTQALRERAFALAKTLGIELQTGVYLGSSGPSYETPAEYRYFRTIGADAVGMSTTPEVIAAKHLGLKVFGVSVITNVAMAGEVATHEDVQLQGEKASKQMTQLMRNLINEI